MRKLLLITAIASLTAFAAPAQAKSKHSDTLHLPAAQPVKITVSLSDDLLHRADNLPEKLRDRGSARGRNDGWSGNGFYGLRDLNALKDDIDRKLTNTLAKADITVSDTAAYELRIVLVDAKPTRPTFKQLSRSSGLSRQSLANGGAKFEAQIIDASGNVIGTSDYDWYETWFDNNYGNSTWSDARTAIGRFARRTAKSLAAPH